MSLTTVDIDVRDDWIGTRNTELDGLMIRGDELTLRGCEFLSGLIKQSAKGGCEPFFCLLLAVPRLVEGLFTLYSFFWTILALHLLVIHAYTWVHVPFTTLSDVLWVVVIQITLFRGHIHINGTRMLAVSI